MAYNLITENGDLILWHGSREPLSGGYEIYRFKGLANDKEIIHILQTSANIKSALKRAKEIEKMRLKKSVKKNPLYKGHSPDIIGRNISEALKKGVPHKVAIAIALKTARLEYRKQHPTGAFPRHLKVIGKVRGQGKNPSKVPTMKKKQKKTSVKKRVKKNPSVTKAFPSGAWQVSDIIDGYLVRRSYLGETKREALALFRAEFGKKKSKRKNPVSTLIKVFQHGSGAKQFKKVGYFTGTGWDTSIAKAEKYSAGAARQLAGQLKVPTGWGLALVTG